MDTEPRPAPARAPHPTRQATAWLGTTYGGLVELAVPHPVHETDTAWLLSCQVLPQPGYPRSPMLAASLVVPKDGSSPFHPAPSAPLADLEPAPSREAAGRVRNQARRINARGCVAAVHSALGGHRSVALPWSPAHEAPGWWDRLNRRYFPGFTHVPADDWNDVIRALHSPGPDTRGLVWVRREAGGQEATGNLLYAHNNNGQVVLLDGVTGSLAVLDTSHIRELVLLRALPSSGTGAERVTPGRS
ncbi:toxin glutamine deamidase domain-containing protein [Streptomyces sp. NPDC003035]|uniref:toxin glutamine deamidase domain-containing protein n=1 Tax=Streptomyces sp. NPDC003035 TaxID=3364676 RepID=UPI00369D30C5